jgi:hypothetical protein
MTSRTERRRALSCVDTALSFLPIPMRWDQKPVMTPEEWAKAHVPAEG